VHNIDPHTTVHTDRYSAGPGSPFISQRRNQTPGYKKLDPLNEDDFFGICAAYGERQAWLMQKARCYFLSKQKDINPKERMRMKMLAMNAEAQLTLLDD
jgi:hypothetical protein